MRPTARWPHPRVAAHRCGGTLAPENTLAGLRLAARLGCRAVEFDVMLSADCTPVLIHDETLERTTDGRGCVADTGDAALAMLDAGAWHSARYAGERIPTFAAAARLCRALDLWANVEIKPAAGHEAATGHAVASMARELWRGAVPPVLSSFSAAALEAAARAAPDLPRGLLCAEVPASWRTEFERLGCYSLHCGWRHATPELLDELAGLDIPLVCYTVNEPAEAARLLRAGVAMVITDRPDLIREDDGICR